MESVEKENREKKELRRGRGGRGETTRRRFNFLIRRDVTVRLPEILASPRATVLLLN